MSDEPARIRVTEDGPYELTGGPTIRAGRILTDDDGQSAEWGYDEPFPSRRKVKLCRCGRSETKPFCDGTHEDRDFDGTETADRGPTAARRHSFPGDGVTLTDDRSLCTSAAFCHDAVTGVWELMEATSDPEVRARVEAIVAKCPSGRLVLERPEGGEVEPDLEPSIVVEEDGPYWVRGRVPVEGVDGTEWEVRNRVALCRCGASRNKPFCDSTHRRIGFEG